MRGLKQGIRGYKMKACLSKEGYLKIKRNSAIKEAYCPYDTSESMFGTICGDWCALFEVYAHSKQVMGTAYKNTEMVRLHCGSGKANYELVKE